MCVDLYTRFNCGLRTTTGIIEYLNEKLILKLDKIPTHNSIRNWVEKSGLAIYRSSGEDLLEENDEYAMVVDESIMVGSEKLLLTLGVSAPKDNVETIKEQDVKVLDISVKPKWNGCEISETLSGVEERIGKSPLYVVSDNDSKLKKAFRLNGYNHVKDVGHTLALLLERRFKKDQQYLAFMKTVSKIRIKENMTSASYLQPPKLRDIARFMNIEPVISWAQKIISNYSSFDEYEQDVFKGIIRHKSFIKGFGEITQIYNLILKRLKHEGLSKQTVNSCIKELEVLKKSRFKNNKGLYGEISSYLLTELEMQEDINETWHCSSDIIETLFGRYKARKSQNPLDGVTGNVLLLPIITKCRKNGLDCKRYLESILLSDVEDWKKANLTESKSLKRREMLKSA